MHFFFGAGASIEFGIPSMKELTKNFMEILKKTGTKEEWRTFLTIYQSLKKVYGDDNVDLEALMSVIDGLKDKNKIRDHLGDLGLFLLTDARKADQDSRSMFQPIVLEKIEDKFKRFIREKIIIKSPEKIDLIRKSIFRFF